MNAPGRAFPCVRMRKSRPRKGAALVLSCGLAGLLAGLLAGTDGAGLARLDGVPVIHAAHFRGGGLDGVSAATLAFLFGGEAVRLCLCGGVGGGLLPGEGGGLLFRLAGGVVDGVALVLRAGGLLDGGELPSVEMVANDLFCEVLDGNPALEGCLLYTSDAADDL